VTPTTRRAFLWACALDVAARKPGNVSLASPGHAMHADMFLASSNACADALLRTGAAVGERIEAAVAATLAAVGCNTNLGIVLLCAPLAAAVERCARAPATVDDLRGRLQEVLARLDVHDARAAFRAIALANPGGLGAVPRQDVRGEATVDLRAAMQLAADRDRIAAQYAGGFADVFETGVGAFRFHVAQPVRAMLAAYLAFLATAPDSHIVRKHGQALAQSVTEKAMGLFDHWSATGRAPAASEVERWDEALKARGVNPGTSADLAVATAFVAAIVDPRLSEAAPAPLAWKVFRNGPTLTRPSG